MHGLSGEADKDGDGVAIFVDSDSLGQNAGQDAPKAILQIFHIRACRWTFGQVNHAYAMFADHRFLRVVVETLTNDQDCLAIAITLGVWERNVCCKRDVAGHFLPEKAELIARVPDVVAGGIDGVLLRFGVVTGAARNHRAAYVRLALKHSDGSVEISAQPVKIGRWRDLSVSGRARLRPSGHSWRRGRRCARSLGAQLLGRRAQEEEECRNQEGVLDSESNKGDFHNNGL